MENKDLIIIALVIALIYLYYQQKKQKTLSDFTGTSANLEEINEVKKVNQIFADFCKNEIGGQDINEIRTKLNGKTLAEILTENEDYELEVDTLRRTKGELEADLLSQSNSFKSLLKEKEGMIKRLGKEKKDLQKWSQEELAKLNQELKELKKDQEWPSLTSSKKDKK